MNQFKQATKRIVAVAASTALVSSTVFGNLGNYPSNFVSNDAFMGTVVVGADARASDTTAAMSIIDELRSQFSGERDRVRITYRDSNNNDEIDVVKSNAQLNYGENLGDSDVTDTLDDGDVDFLEDGTFDNGASDEDYTQELDFFNGEFNYALRDEVDDVEDISDGVFYNSGETYMTYTMEFDSTIPVSTDNDDNDEDFVGEILTIMGNEFTISSISQSGGDITELELIGGANKISLGEDESTTVMVNGREYDIEVRSVSDDEVLLSVNGQSDSIDEFDTEELGGINIAVTDLVASSRDAIRGYAEIVVGGQKVTLEDNGEVQVNDEDVSDEFDDYLVESTIATGGFNTITITYKVDDDVLLEEGDSLIDPLFTGFELLYDGTNNPDYATIEMRNGDDIVRVEGELINGESLNREILYTTTTTGTDGVTYMRGDQDEDRIFFSGSDLSFDVGTTGITLNNSADEVTFDVDSTAIEGSGFFIYDDAEEQYLYEITSTNANDNELDLDELLDGRDETDLSPSEVLSDLELSIGGSSSANDSAGTVTIDIDELGTAELAFVHELLMDFSSLEDATGIEGTSQLIFKLDDDDTDEDETTDDDETIVVTFSWDDNDDEVDIDLSGSQTEFTNQGGLADMSEDDDDTRQYVTAYGTVYEHDNDEGTFLNIMVPEEQVYGMVTLLTGSGGTQEMTTTVDAEDLDETVEDLEDRGYIIVDTENLSDEEIEFDIDEPMLDTDVSGIRDMIVVGGPAVNQVAADLLGMSYPTYGEASGVDMGEGVIRYYSSSNSILVYGYEAADTRAAVERLNRGGLSGSVVNVE